MSQSWGWKSSALRSEEYLTNLEGDPVAAATAAELGGGVGTAIGAGAGAGVEGNGLEEGVLGWVGDVGGEALREGSLRATVVVGVI